MEKIITKEKTKILVKKRKAKTNIVRKSMMIFTWIAFFILIVLGYNLFSMTGCFAAGDIAGSSMAIAPQLAGKAGPTQPIQAYIQIVQPSIKAKLQQLKQQTTDIKSSSFIEQILAQKPKAIPFDNFPVKTREMTPGIVKATKLNLTMLPQPIFVIGSDDMSINWFKRYQKRLKAINALGILVQVNNKTDYEQVQQIANGLTILPMSGDVIAHQLKIYHYPLLISRKVAEQGGKLYE